MNNDFIYVSVAYRGHRNGILELWDIVPEILKEMNSFGLFHLSKRKSEIVGVLPPLDIDIVSSLLEQISSHLVPQNGDVDTEFNIYDPIGKEGIYVKNGNFNIFDFSKEDESYDVPPDLMSLISASQFFPVLSEMDEV